VHVINLSLAGPADRLLASLLERALARGISVVGAAPSEESSAENGFPASVRGVIAVVNADTPAVAAPVAALRLAAPGLEVLTLAPGGHYDYASGVSMSTALVSGVAALLLEHVSASAQRIAFVARLPELLQQTGDAREQHHPEINAARALRTTLRSELAQK
jgi:subtilisin family serine protease